MATAEASAPGARVVVVTGASSGVGRATARAFGALGDRVALLARGSEGLEAAAREVRERGGEALAVPTDVAEPEAVARAAETIERELGPIDVWVNDAMATVFAPFARIEPAEFERATRVTYLGTVWGTRVALERMRPRDRGAVIQVGSALAYRGIPLQSAYCGAKHAIKGFTESVRTELMHEGSAITISMVQLPAHNTPQFETQRSKMPRHPQPVPPIFQPEVAAEAVTWIAEHPRRELLVGAPTLKTVWGNRVAPSVADRYLARTGFDSQQTDERVPEREGNLFESVDRDAGARGRFDERAKARSVQLWLATRGRRPLLASALGAGIAVAGLGLAQRRD